MQGSVDDSALVFADLADARQELDNARGSPKNVRRCFSRYVDLTQRLTAAMRTDFSRRKRSTWVAADFSGWTDDTAFLKWLRNEDQHGNQIYVSVHERHFYELECTGDRLLVFEGTWALIDQLTDSVPGGMTMHLPDPATGKLSEVVVEPERVEYQYLLQPRTQEATDWIRRLVNSDIHELTDRSFAVLTQYHAFFRQRADA
jgi:hypothetical protein